MSLGLTNMYKNVVHPHLLGGHQVLYKFNAEWGLSCVNSRALHSYKFAWEIAVIRHGHLVYDTPLTDDVEVFLSDKDANDFIHKAAKYFHEYRGA